MSKKLFSFVETTRFTKRVTDLLDDDQYATLQWRLIEFPIAGDMIPGSGGIRKIRLSAKGKGTRGGARVIYYFAMSREQIFMLDIYAKNEKSDLTIGQVRELKKLVDEWTKQ
jgi:mRNA-degrading endonuclease RelE of RelBE toxin-antitoxin system